jgi:hypothetical protein
VLLQRCQTSLQVTDPTSLKHLFMSNLPLRMHQTDFFLTVCRSKNNNKFTHLLLTQMKNVSFFSSLSVIIFILFSIYSVRSILARSGLKLHQVKPCNIFHQGNSAWRNLHRPTYFRRLYQIFSLFATFAQVSHSFHSLSRVLLLLALLTTIVVVFLPTSHCLLSHSLQSL